MSPRREEYTRLAFLTRQIPGLLVRFFHRFSKLNIYASWFSLLKYNNNNIFNQTLVKYFFPLSFYSHLISFSINENPFSGKVPLLSLIAVSIDSTTNFRDCSESMGRTFHEKSPLIRFLIQPQTHPSYMKKYLFPPSSVPLITIFVESILSLAMLNGFNRNLMRIFSGPALKLFLLMLPLIVVNNHFVKVGILSFYA